MLDQRGRLLRARRLGVIMLALGIMLAPVAARAQPSAMPVVDVLSMQTPDSETVQLTAIRQGLKEAGFIEGKNVAFDLRFVEGRNDLLHRADLGRFANDDGVTEPLHEGVKPLRVPGGLDADSHGRPQRSTEALHGAAFVDELLLEDFARGRVEDGNLLLARVQITSNQTSVTRAASCLGVG